MDPGSGHGVGGEIRLALFPSHVTHALLLWVSLGVSSLSEVTLAPGGGGETGPGLMHLAH